MALRISFTIHLSLSDKLLFSRLAESCNALTFKRKFITHKFKKKHCNKIQIGKTNIFSLFTLFIWFTSQFLLRGFDFIFLLLCPSFFFVSHQKNAMKMKYILESNPCVLLAGGKTKFPHTLVFHSIRWAVKRWKMMIIPSVNNNRNKWEK